MPPYRSLPLPAPPAVLLAASLLFGACLGGHDHPSAPPPEYYGNSVEGLDPAAAPATVELEDGDTLVLTAAPVKKVLRGRETRMFAYNGSIPGPFLKVKQGASVTVRLRNRLGLPTTLHPHGLRLASRFDGTPEVQREIADADSFDYTLTFPDPGAFWYHPHLREAYALEMGLYGGILVAPADSAYWQPVDREVGYLLDDVLLDKEGMVPFRKDGADHAMMGRFGNVFLANGDTAATLTVRRKELVRFHLTNACNTRVLSLGFHKMLPGDLPVSLYMNTVGTDLGRYQRRIVAAYELVSPGERVAIEAYFPEPGPYRLMHRIEDPDGTYRYVPFLAIEVLPDTVTTGYGADFYQAALESPHAVASIDSVRSHLARPPDKELLLTVAMSHAGHLMKRAHEDAGAKGVEWEDHPVAGMDNAASDHRNTRWIIRDRATGKENHAIDWVFRRGDKVKIAIYNDSASLHPMPHPIHFHGQRFLVAKVNGKDNPDLAWKDTYLVGRGERTEILLDASNPGEWMAHCHIAEHLETMMMFNYRVEE